jgi:hypothetical protein
MPIVAAQFTNSQSVLLLLQTVRNLKVRRCSGLQCRNIQTKFRQNRLNDLED